MHVGYFPKTMILKNRLQLSLKAVQCTFEASWGNCAHNLHSNKLQLASKTHHKYPPLTTTVAHI